MKLKDVRKNYYLDKKIIRALDGITLDIDICKRNVLIGPSACGKSTLLKAIGGLIPIDKGKILKDNLKTSFVFQNPRLLPWLNVRENIAFSMKDKPLYEKIDRWISIMGLDDFKNAYPSELSGGMKARVNLARAFVYPNDFLLMDEPFASLDQVKKEELEIELLSYIKKANTGFLFVSHDLNEALNLGEIIFIMKKGKIVSKLNLAEKSWNYEGLKSYFKKIIGGENEK
ncbi:ATP-binding cassette domain-containing protein [Anaerococcus sp. WCA-380-WT-2B]|uniref:ATP-binding cassette domain-containing protein n=1 Tax=Anaerococcus porci TaxID=2652269 RepID=A0A6N7VDL6_9FIRM|nr:ATP-binding cassette domain-containing protein [Anaerococcus porci]MSS77550.1 ATP-binding cassette domain-containing protein [Anaerococcus porci]